MQNQSENCEGRHRFFVAMDGFVEIENKACLVIVCTACGESRLIEHLVVKKLDTRRPSGQ